MSTSEKVAKLRKLLERVRTRAGTHGENGGAVAPITSSSKGLGPVEEPVQLTTWTPPPPDDLAPEVGIPVDVDYVETTHVVVADPGGVEVAEGHFDSTERLVVASTAVADADPDEGADDVDQPPAESVDGSAQTAHSVADGLGEEAGEPAPASSRRPVMAEPDDRLARMAFGAEEAPPPLHTPPPESGRVPASPSDDFDRDPLETQEIRQSHEPLIAEATRALLESAAPVANLIGGPGRPVPTTFSAILDETLSL